MSNSTRQSREEAKAQNEKHAQILANMLLEPENKYCSECLAKGPRWASSNLGVFFCIRCSGIHRNLGVHISKVRSVNLDTWTPEQIANMKSWGNKQAAAYWEYNLPADFHRPVNSDTEMEAFIRAKYERKKFARKPTDPPLEHVQTAPEEISRSDDKKKKKNKERKSPLTLGDDDAGNGSFLPVAAAPAPAPVQQPQMAAASSSSNTFDLLGGFESMSVSQPAAAQAAPPPQPVPAAAPAAAPAAGGSDLFALFGGSSSSAPAQPAAKTGKSDIMALFAAGPSQPAPSPAQQPTPLMFGGSMQAPPAQQPQQQFAMGNQWGMPASQQPQQFGGMMGGQWGMQQQPPQPQFGMQQQPPLPQFGMQQPQFGMQPQQPMFGMQPQQQQQQQFGMGNQWGMMSQQPQPNSFGGGSQTKPGATLDDLLWK